MWPSNVDKFRGSSGCSMLFHVFPGRTAHVPEVRGTVQGVTVASERQDVWPHLTWDTQLGSNGDMDLIWIENCMNYDTLRHNAICVCV